jgi:hypothetical protein
MEPHRYVGDDPTSPHASHRQLLLSRRRIHRHQAHEPLGVTSAVLRRQPEIPFRQLAHRIPYIVICQLLCIRGRHAPDLRAMAHGDVTVVLAVLGLFASVGGYAARGVEARRRGDLKQSRVQLAIRWATSEELYAVRRRD